MKSGAQVLLVAIVMAIAAVEGKPGNLYYAQAQVPVQTQILKCQPTVQVVEKIVRVEVNSKNSWL